MRCFPLSCLLATALAFSLPLSASTNSAAATVDKDKPVQTKSAKEVKHDKTTAADGHKKKTTDEVQTEKTHAEKVKTEKPHTKKPDAEETHTEKAHVKKSESKKGKSKASDALADIEHERVDYWVAAFSKMHDYHKKIAAGFARKPKYQDMIERKLRKRGMPENLIYLAMEESAFNPDAGSRESAVGLWQLTPATARLYGLKVNKKVDERKNVEKETDAALRVLSHLHDRFGCWYLAAAAYDSGENRIARIMRKRFGRERGRDRDYYKIWDQIPGETRDYVPAIIALKRIGKDPAKYGF